MTPEAQIIAIAELCGFKNVRKIEVSEYCDDPMEPSTIMVTKIIHDGCGKIPNYPGSLDAMAEARKALTPHQQTVFCQELRRELGFHGHTYFDLVDASASVQAKVFLRAVGRWQEKGEK